MLQITNRGRFARRTRIVDVFSSYIVSGNHAVEDAGVAIGVVKPLPDLHRYRSRRRLS
jgi:hypothetical protein